MSNDGMLSQDEIDALLAQAKELRGTGEQARAAHDRAVKLYDFKRPEKFSREQLRMLERLFERFARLLSTSLSAYIRTNINVKLESVTPLRYQDFVFSLQQPTLIQVIELTPLPGQVALEITPSIVFPMYEQMMGGQHPKGSEVRPLTDVELELLKRPIERILQCLVETWQDILPIRPRLLRAEQDPQFAQVAATNTPVIVVSLEVSVSETLGMMSLCLPDLLVDELLPLLSEERLTNDGTESSEDAERMRRAMVDVALPLIAQLGRSSLTVRQIRDLQPGDVIKLEAPANSDINLLVGDQRLFAARVGQISRKLVVRVTGLARGRERVEEPVEAAHAQESEGSVPNHESGGTEEG